MDIVLTGIVGLALVGCGFFLGRQGMDGIIALAIREFINEMIKAELINEKKLNSYIIKKYGAEL